MSKLVKWLLLLIATPVLLLIVAFVALGFFINGAAQKAVETGATYALGVPTTLQSADVGILRGRFQIDGLKVANPQGFTADKFMSLGQGRVAVSLPTLMKDTIELPEFTLDTIDVNLERKSGGANYKVIMDNLAKLGGKGGQSKPAPKEAGPEKRLIINQLTIRKVTVNADLGGSEGVLGQVVGKVTKVTFPINEIKLSNVGRTGTGVGGTGVTIEELSSIIVQAVLAAAAENGGGLLPADLLGDLKNGLAGLDGFKDLQVEVGGKLQEFGKQLGDQLNKNFEDVSKNLGKQLDEKVGDSLKNLLPKPK
jgi:hypothetical protein